MYDLVAADHPLRRVFEETVTTRQPRGPVSLTFRGVSEEDDPPWTETGERLILTHPMNDATGALVGIMLIARNLEYLGQVQSTLRYSRKLAALGRLSAGVAHEVKNPLNAMMIHLELLAAAVYSSAAPRSSAREARGGGDDCAPPPVDTRATLFSTWTSLRARITRLDEVVQGFLKFTRPEDLKLQPVRLQALFDEVMPIVRPEAERYRVELVVDC